MISIIDLMKEELSARKIMRTVDLEERMEWIYTAHPALGDIDYSLVEVRKSRIMASLDNQMTADPALERREDDLIQERNEYIRLHEIDPEFDSPKPICIYCKDTGWCEVAGSVKVVCRHCMNKVINNCFEASGMKDYSTYKLSSFSLSYTGDKKKRSRIFKAGQKFIEKDGGGGIRLYLDEHRSGKTYLAVVLVKYAIVEGHSAYFSKAEDYGEFDDDNLTFLKECDFLVIDDYESEVTQNWRHASNINAVLEARCAGELPTLVISSSSKEELIAGSDARISGKLTGAQLL